MSYKTSTSTTSKAMLWTGRVIVTLATLFFLFDAGMKLVVPEMVAKPTGWHTGTMVALGIILLISTILYALPRTAAFGAILITGYLGGAVATNLFVKSPVLFNVLAVVYGVLLWGGLYLRDSQLRAILPVRR